jgi:RNA polymerase sigma factor (sigma-70 family)
MKPPDHRSDAELLGAPADPEAFAAFYRRHVRAVIALACRNLPTTEAGDVVAEVFATALVYRRRFDPARGSAGAWLAGIAQHKIADAQRRGHAQARLCRRLGISVPRLAEAPRLDGAPELLAALPDEQRQAVRARVIDEQSYEQIAREQGVSPQAVRQRVSRGLRALRSQMKEREQ